MSRCGAINYRLNLVDWLEVAEIVAMAHVAHRYCTMWRFHRNSNLTFKWFICVRRWREKAPNYNFGPTNHFNQFLFFILNPLSNLKSVKVSKKISFTWIEWIIRRSGSKAIKIQKILIMMKILILRFNHCRKPKRIFHIIPRSPTPHS